MKPLYFYRLASALSRHGVPFAPKLIDYFSRAFFCCWIPHTASIGKGVVLGYGGLGIVLHSNARIGDRTHIDQHVTIGGTGTSKGVPTIGRDVYIGAGAKVLGPITIGDGAVIGANSVVLRDLPAGAVAVGVPARIVRDKPRDCFFKQKQNDK